MKVVFTSQSILNTMSGRCSYASMILLCCMISPMAFAQSPDTLRSEYRENYKQQLSIKTSLNNDIETFELRSPGFNPDLRPNTSLANSYSFSYEFIVFAISFT